MNKDSHLIFETLVKSQETTAYKLGNLSSILVNLKRRIQINQENPNSFTEKELILDLEKALNLLETIKYPYSS